MTALQLLLVARDRGDPFYESTRYMTVKVTDENDKVPVFPVYRVRRQFPCLLICIHFVF